jgi:hypothetical protein
MHLSGHAGPSPKEQRANKHHPSHTGLCSLNGPHAARMRAEQNTRSFACRRAQGSCPSSPRGVIVVMMKEWAKDQQRGYRPRGITGAADAERQRYPSNNNSDTTTTKANHPKFRLPSALLSTHLLYKEILPYKLIYKYIA